MTEMEEYFTQIYDGKIVACKKIRQYSSTHLVTMASQYSMMHSLLCP